jgi:hypothetical protein
MAWINAEEEIALRADSARLAEVEPLLRRLQDIQRISGGVAHLAQVEVSNLLESGQIEDDAEPIAVAGVVSQERARLTEEKARELRDNHGKEYAAKFRATEGSVIEQKLREKYESDGTFELIQSRVEDDVIEAIDAEVRREEEERLRVLLGQPEQRERIKQERLELLRTGEEGEKIRLDTRATLEQEWDEEILNELKATIMEEENCREQDYKTNRRDAFASSRSINSFREETRAKNEAAWAEATLEDLKDAISDEESERAIALRVLQEAIKADEQEKLMTAKELLTKFETTGIDTSDFSEGQVVSLYLGKNRVEQRTQRVKRRGSSYYDDVPYAAKVVDCSRMITVVALGDGKFAVKDDSMNNSSSPHDKRAALPNGTVVTMGMKLIVDRKDTYTQKLVAGAELLVDDNTTDDEVISTHERLADVTVNGVSARHTDHVEFDSSSKPS